MSSQTKDIKEIIDEMKEGGICAVKCANESDVCVKIREEDNTGNESGLFFLFLFSFISVTWPLSKIREQMSGPDLHSNF